MSQAFKRKLRLWITATYGGRSTKKIYGSTSRSSSSNSSSSSSSTAEAKQNRTEQNSDDGYDDVTTTTITTKMKKTTAATDDWKNQNYSETFSILISWTFEEELRIYELLKYATKGEKVIVVYASTDAATSFHTYTRTHTYWKKRTRIPKIYSQLTQAIHMNGFF